MAGGVFVYYYVRFSRIIDARLSGDVFNNASLVFSAPADCRGPARHARRRRRTPAAGPLRGRRRKVRRSARTRLAGDRLEIRPGPASFFSRARNRRGSGSAGISGRAHCFHHVPGQGAGPLDSYQLEPELITTLFDSTRSKRRLVRYQDLPKVLVNAILATEDHRFFSHHGVNYLPHPCRGDGRHSRREDRMQGGSTLTMQLARNFFLTPRPSLIREGARDLHRPAPGTAAEERSRSSSFTPTRSTWASAGVSPSMAWGKAASSYFNKDVSSLDAARGGAAGGR